ncbi:MAG: hypothetical protein ACKPCI_10925 [Dolichospermum sp.]
MNNLLIKKLHLQRSISEIQEILRIINSGEDEQKYKRRLLDYQKQLKIIVYQSEDL